MTLLSIVGEDISAIVPLLYAYKKQIKRHILLCDDDPYSYRKTKTLQKGMQKFSAYHLLGWYTRIVSTDEDSKQAILESVEKEFDSEDEIWLNVTDAYPILAIVLSELVYRRGGRVLSYDPFDNDLHIIEQDGSMSTRQLESRIDIASYLMLHNYTLIEKQDKASLLPRRKAIYALYKDESRYNKVRRAILDAYFEKSTPSAMLGSNDLVDILCRLHILDEEKKLIPSKQKVLQGDLFEEYIFWLTEALKPDDIALGVKIDFDDLRNEPEFQKRVKNEFDILIMHKNRMCTIECKLSHSLDGLDIVYKYDAIIDYFGKAAKAIIANVSSARKEKYLGSKASGNFGHSTLRRAHKAGIAIYHESIIDPVKFQNLVRNFFELE